MKISNLSVQGMLCPNGAENGEWKRQRVMYVFHPHFNTCERMEGFKWLFQPTVDTSNNQSLMENKHKFKSVSVPDRFLSLLPVLSPLWGQWLSVPLVRSSALFITLVVCVVLPDPDSCSIPSKCHGSFPHRLTFWTWGARTKHSCSVGDGVNPAQLQGQPWSIPTLFKGSPWGGDQRNSILRGALPGGCPCQSHHPQPGSSRGSR